MITSRKELKAYIALDFKAQGMEHPFLARFTYGENWRMFNYIRVLRHLEYYKNLKSATYRV